MKTLKILMISMALIAVAGCQDKQPPETAKQEKIKAAGERFDNADKELSVLLDKIESTDLDIDTRTKLVCKDYPELYKQHYMPALLELSPDQFSEQSLLSDYDFVQKDFQQRFNIQCTPVP